MTAPIPPDTDDTVGTLVVVVGIIWFALIVLPAGCQPEEQTPSQLPASTSSVPRGEDSRIPPDHLRP
ncbi:hypothetical protein HY312_04575 [Candidatus Saccharibacteria bacterium]|nr:hypothetical protein [Candidatus Saccharibacteria bacterium]